VADAVARMFEAKVVPAVEAACRQMLAQASAAMQRGAEEHLRAGESRFACPFNLI
jgi:hypothetical protein